MNPDDTEASERTDESSANGPDTALERGPAGGRSRWGLVGVATLIVVILAVAAIMGLPQADAFGRVEEHVVVGPDEVIDETLVVGGRSVRIEGTIEGDVLVSAQRVIVTGTIHGNLEAVAEEVEVEVEGLVEGALHCLCREVSVRGRVAQNLYALGDSTTLTSTGQVARDAVVLGSLVRIDGRVGRDLRAYVENMEVTGTVDRNILGAASRVAVSGSASVSGDIEVSVPTADRVSISPDAQVAGHTQIEEKPQLAESKYVRPEYYIAQLVQVVAAFVVGVLLIRLFPRILTARLVGTKGVFVGLGIGVLLLVAIPIAAVVLMLTLIGLPLGLIGLAAYAVALYLSSIVVAARLGSVALGHRWRQNTSLALFVGLVMLAIATEIPVVGGWVTFVTLVLGLGLIYRAVREGRAHALQAAS